MEREIKFRGKTIDKNEWIYGSLVRHIITDKCYILKGDGLSVERNHEALYGSLFITEYFHEVIPETVGQFTGLKGYEGDIIDVCIFLVSPQDPDNDQHFRGYIDFRDGKYVFVICKYNKWDGSKSEWADLKPSHLPFSDAELDDDGTFTVPYLDFLAISGNLGEFCEDNVKIIGNSIDNPELLDQ